MSGMLVMLAFLELEVVHVVFAERSFRTFIKAVRQHVNL